LVLLERKKRTGGGQVFESMKSVTYFIWDKQKTCMLKGLIRPNPLLSHPLPLDCLNIEVEEGVNIRGLRLINPFNMQGFCLSIVYQVQCTGMIRTVCTVV